ncbi:MAG: GNAT family N-acetyltransferase [Gillisia sp.]
MTSKIRLATLKDLSEIKALTESCALAMQQKNIFQWNEHYPSLEILREDIQKKELYVFEQNSSIAGIMVLTALKDKEYEEVTWLTPKNSKNLYVHRLATSPKIWGKGIGTKLMDFAETFARRKKYNSIRLDTFSQNKRNQRFYEARGYRKLEDIYFPKQSDHPFHCYELLL